LQHVWGAKGYYPLFTEEVVLKASAETGIMQKIGKTIRVVDSFSMGYTNLRGFDFQGVGPRDKTTKDALNGTRMWRASVEIKFPSGLPDDWKISASVFNDWGCLWEPGQKDSNTQSDTKIRAAAGAGILWASPFGPLGLTYAIPYMSQKYDERRSIQLQFSNIF
jgi:outer membrane protein insertion porin family